MDLVGRKLPMRAGGAVSRLPRRTIDALDAELAAAGDDLASIRDAPGRRARGACAPRPTGCWPTAWPSPLDALAGATPYLRLFSLVTGGWIMARQALGRHGSLVDADPADKAFYEGKVLTARFFCEQILPQAAGLIPAVTATNRDLAAAVF